MGRPVLNQAKHPHSALYLFAIVILISPPAFAKWPQNTPNKAIELFPGCQPWKPCPQQAITPANALAKAVESAIKQVNSDLEHGSSTFMFPRAIALKVAERFRAVGWDVRQTNGQNPSEHKIWLEFVWAENK